MACCVLELQLNSDHRPYVFYKQWKKLLVLYTDCDYNTLVTGTITIVLNRTFISVYSRIFSCISKIPNQKYTRDCELVKCAINTVTCYFYYSSNSIQGAVSIFYFFMHTQPLPLHLCVHSSPSKFQMYKLRDLITFKIVPFYL